MALKVMPFTLQYILLHHAHIGTCTLLQVSSIAAYTCTLSLYSYPVVKYG